MSEPLLQLWSVTPDVAVGVDESLCIVLVTTEGKGPRWTLSNVEAFRQTLDQAQAYVSVHEAVMADWKDDPDQGRAILSNAWPREDVQSCAARMRDALETERIKRSWGQ